jgi:hypothetical protein
VAGEPAVGRTGAFFGEAAFHRAHGFEVRVRAIVGADGVDSGELAFPIERQKTGEGGVEAEKAVEVEGSEVRGGGLISRRGEADAGADAVVAVFAVGDEEANAVGSAAEEEDHDDVAFSAIGTQLNLGEGGAESG